MTYEERPYRPKARTRLVPGPNDSLRRMVWLRSGRSRPTGKNRPGRIAVRAPRAHSRRCTVQARYIRQGQKVNGQPRDLVRSARAHLAYIEREGVERDGSAGRLYDATVSAAVDETTREALRRAFAAPLADEKHQFRFIVSPEDAHQLDMTEFIRELMQRVERDIGQPLIWAAVNHFNTAHPHAHVVVRGVDRRGREVRFDRQYISHGFRRRGEGNAPQLLGPRTELEHQQQLEREVEQHRFTSLDRQLAAKARATHGVLQPSDLNATQKRRLETLEALGLASRAEGGAWQLAASWERTLRALGERGDIIKQMHRALRQVDPARFVVASRDAPAPSLPTEANEIHGRVASIGLRDDVPDGLYAVIETARGSGYYVPVHLTQEIRDGDYVTLRRWLDRNGQPRLAIDRHKLSITQQITYVGPTWLDAAQPSGDGAFARELVARQRERGEFLRQQGLEGVNLRAAEKRQLTSHYAKQLGKARAWARDGFQGRIVSVHTTPSNGSYIVIANDTEVALLRATKQSRGLVGQEVQVAMTPESEKGARKQLRVTPLAPKPELER